MDLRGETGSLSHVLSLGRDRCCKRERGRFPSPRTMERMRARGVDATGTGTLAIEGTKVWCSLPGRRLMRGDGKAAECKRGKGAWGVGVPGAEEDFGERVALEGERERGGGRVSQQSQSQSQTANQIVLILARKAYSY